MRAVLAGIAAAIALLAAANVQPAAAQNTTRPYCMRGGTYGAGSWDCSYYTMEQCLETASGLNGTCMPNPNYRGPKKAAPKRRQERN
jgi:hypothetical protein